MSTRRVLMIAVAFALVVPLWMRYLGWVLRGCESFWMPPVQ